MRNSSFMIKKAMWRSALSTFTMDCPRLSDADRLRFIVAWPHLSLSVCVCSYLGITSYSFADLNQRTLQCYVREPFQFYCSTHPLLNWQPPLQSSHTWPFLECDLAWFQEKSLMFNQQAGPFFWLRLLIKWVFDWWSRVDDTFGSCWEVYCSWAGVVSHVVDSSGWYFLSGMFQSPAISRVYIFCTVQDEG